MINQTIVTELKVTLADLHTRKRILKCAGSSVLSDVSAGASYGTARLWPNTPKIFEPFLTTLVISTDKPIVLTFFEKTTNLDVFSLTVRDQFSINGSTDRGIRLSTDDTLGVLIQYVIN